MKVRMSCPACGFSAETQSDDFDSLDDFCTKLESRDGELPDHDCGGGQAARYELAQAGARQTERTMGMAKTLRIGTARLVEPMTVRKGYEVACWYQMVECQPQETPITVTLTPEGSIQFVCYGFDGVVKESYFPSLFGGNAISNGLSNRDLGEPARYHVQTYDFMVCGAMFRNEPGKVQFDLDYSAIVGYSVILDSGKVASYFDLKARAQGGAL